MYQSMYTPEEIARMKAQLEQSYQNAALQNQNINTAANMVLSQNGRGSSNTENDKAAQVYRETIQTIGGQFIRAHYQNNPDKLNSEIDAELARREENKNEAERKRQNADNAAQIQIGIRL